jgi:F-type H+-transporting ATPase subunit c
MKVLGTVLGVLVGLVVLASPALAQDHAAGGGGIEMGMIALAAGLGLGIAAFGAAIAQGRATAAAMESIGRNPNSADRIFTPLIVGLALMEALALYALVVAFTLAGKIPGVG